MLWKLDFFLNNTYLTAAINIYTPFSIAGDALSTWNESSLMNPEEMGEYAEGDILIPQLGRNGMRDESMRWPSGIIPYVIEGRYSEYFISSLVMLTWYKY